MKLLLFLLLLGWFISTLFGDSVNVFILFCFYSKRMSHKRRELMVMFLLTAVVSCTVCRTLVSATTSLVL